MLSLPKILRSLWSYRLTRWALYTYLSLTIIANLLLIFFGSDQQPQNFHEMAMRTFPHPDLPEDQTQTLREVLFIIDKLRSALQEVLLPEDAKDEDFALYDLLTRSLETRGDISWLVYQESNAASFFTGINRGREERRLVDGQMVKDIKLQTTDEQRLEEKHGIFKRLNNLYKYFSDMTHGKRDHLDGDSADRGEYKQPNSWAPEFVEDRLPAFKPQPDGAIKSEPSILANPIDDAKADELYNDLMRRRNRAIAYLKIHPPKPMGWAPKSTDAWEKTNRADIQAGNLHGMPEYWQPMYRSWGLEDVPLGWKERELTEEEQEKESEGIMKKFNLSQERRARKKEYLASVTKESEGEGSVAF